MNKKIMFFIIFTIAIIFVFAGIVYAKYQKDIKVTYKANTGEMICEVEIETNDSYKINEIPYFFVKVKNYKEESGNKVLTATNIEYNLTIRNKTDDSTGMFIWQNEDKGDCTNTYLETVTTNTYSFEKTEKEDVFKVFVKNSQNVESLSDIEIEVEINAIQKEVN